MTIPINGRTPIVIVELDVDTCEHEFGVAPCQAALPDGRNNYLLYSESIDNAASFGNWVVNGDITTTPDVAIAPDGTVTADRLTTTATGVAINCEMTQGVYTLPAGAPAVFLIWVKRVAPGSDPIDTIYMRLTNLTLATLVNEARFNFMTLEAINCSIVETTSDGWFRLKMVAPAGFTSAQILQASIGFVPYNGGPIVTGKNFYAWGAQLCFPTYTSDFRYIKTTATAVPFDPNVEGTGTTECFNTYPTCQDRVNFSKTTKTLRFTNVPLPQFAVEGEAPPLPIVREISLAPAQLTPREGLGARASCSVYFTDLRHTDEGFDPYIKARRGGSNWYNKSTWARRFLARNANVENRVMRVINGFRDETGVVDLSTFVTRTYIVQSVSWPDMNGDWSITGKDPLRLADGDRAVWPPRARIKVLEDYEVTDTILLCEDLDGRLISDFATGQPYIRIGQEFMKMTAVSTVDDQTSVTVERASLPDFYPGPQFNVAETIEANTAILPCYLIDEETLPDVLYLLLNTGCGIDSSYLPLADWQQSMLDAGRESLRLSRLIPESIPIKDLITEITKLNVNVWWSERDTEVKVQAVLVNPPVVASFNDRENFLVAGVTVDLGSRARISQAWCYFGHQWPLADISKLESFYAVEVFADLESEIPEFFGQAAIQETRSPWLALSQGADVVQMVSNVVYRYRYGKVSMAFTVDPKDRAPWNGDAVSVLSGQVVGADGVPTPVNFYILAAQEEWTPAGISVQYSGEGLITGILAAKVREAAITEDSMVDYDAQTAQEKEANVSICANSGQFADGQPAYTLAG